MRSSTTDRPPRSASPDGPRTGRPTSGALRTGIVGLLAASLTASLAVALTACTAGSAQPTAGEAASSTPAAAPSSGAPPASSPTSAGQSEQPTSVLPTDLGTIATAPAGAPPEEDIDPGSGPLPTWDATSRAAVVQAAEKTMTAFAQPRADHDTWWAGLRDHVTPESAPDLVLIDPANITASHVTGAGRITADASAAVATVSVPTNSGDWTLTMVRASAAAPWLADRITPPAGQH